MALTKLPKNAIGTGAIDASKIEDGTIQNAELAGSLTGTQLASTFDLSSKTVTLPNTSVTSDQLAGSIANNKLSNSTFTIRGTSRALGDSFSLNPNVDWQSVIVADGSTTTTGSAGKGYFINTTSAAHTFTLPASATRGDTIALLDYAGTFATNKLTINRNGHNIQGVANDSLIGTNRASLVLVYVDSTKGWLYAEEHNVAFLASPAFISATGGTITTSGNFKIHSFTGDGCFVVSTVGNISTVPTGGPANVDYLVVAGGGGGHVAGGGGAGGFREGRVLPAPESYTASPLVAPAGLPVSAQTYPITVGAGGSAAVLSPSGPSPLPGIPASSNGSNSIFSTITSSGGGKGGGWGCNAAGSGGSGGGGLENASAGSGNTPPVNPSQGNPGGNNPGNNGSGGGGGATQSAPSTPNVENGNPGGNGATTSISGSPVIYAGGGGGGEMSVYAPATAGTGGTGGGGNAVPNGVGNNGTNNTGGGGAGGAYAGGPAGAAGWMGGSGGKGIVIIRYKFQ